MKSLLLFFSLIFVRNYSQNIVPNGDFEEKTRCPGKIGLNSLISNISDCKFWFNPTKASPDYYNVCSEIAQYKVPKNIAGNQIAKSGNGYIGLGFFPSENNECEYASVKLTKPIERDKIYCLKMSLSVPDKANYSTSTIGALLSDKAPKRKDKSLIQVDNFIYLKSDSVLTDKLNWIDLCQEIRGSEYEKSEFLTIGWFSVATPKIRIGKGNPNNDLFEIYFYIDDVSLEEISAGKDCKCKSIDKSISSETIIVKSNYDSAKYKPLILKNVNFETNKTELLSSSFSELDYLVKYLKKNDKMNIEISGFSDNEGNEISNVNLSKGRAEAVAIYLTKNGVSNQRVKYFGYGSKNPMKPNTTKENKAFNRRVEFRLIEN